MLRLPVTSQSCFQEGGFKFSVQAKVPKKRHGKQDAGNGILHRENTVLIHSKHGCTRIYSGGTLGCDTIFYQKTTVMKRCFILLSVVVVLGCNDNPATKKVSAQHAISSIATDASRIYSNQASALDTTAKLFNFVYRDSVTGEIPFPYGLTLIQEYRDKEHHEDRELPRQARHGWSKCVWFGVEELEDVCRKIHRSGGDGVRIYFAKYPNKDEFTSVPTRRHGKEDVSKKRTLVLVTTKRLSDTTSIDDVTEKDLKIAFTEKHDAAKFATYNHGELCPKNCVGTIKLQ